MDVIVPNWPGMPPNVGALSTTRRGGISTAPWDDGTGGGGLNLGAHVGDRIDHVLHNRALLRSMLPSEPAWLSQIHGTHVVDAAGVDLAPEADASIAVKRGAVCAILTADCLPVLLCDTKGIVVGAAHAGWRGLAHGILEQTVAAMRQAGAESISAWLGPAIGPERFEVGAEVRDTFLGHDRAACVAFRPVAGLPDKYLADIYALARARLAAVGVRQCFGGEFCTVSDPASFYSYRRDRITGRMASLIWLK
ncbi:MAG TPA: peptidoglycan editing factor PgeF [Burkholderiaceae bacterium]|nr:peptidoglycan editing factor PgeF [Burkholderiaceae bacterium]